MDKEFFTFTTSPSQTTLILGALIFFLLVLLFLKSKLSKYLNKRNLLKELAAKYERKRECRGSLAYHYFWQLNSGENNQARQTADDILELDEELKEMYEQYQQLKARGIVDLKKI